MMYNEFLELSGKSESYISYQNIFSAHKLRILRILLWITTRIFYCDFGLLHL